MTLTAVAAVISLGLALPIAVAKHLATVRLRLTIAEARRDLAAACAEHARITATQDRVIDRVARLHLPWEQRVIDEERVVVCTSCATPWPCKTARTVNPGAGGDAPAVWR